MTYCQKCGKRLLMLGGEQSNTKHRYACDSCEIVYVVKVNGFSGKEVSQSKRRFSAQDKEDIARVKSVIEAG